MEAPGCSVVHAPTPLGSVASSLHLSELEFWREGPGEVDDCLGLAFAALLGFDASSPHLVRPEFLRHLGLEEQASFPTPRESDASSLHHDQFVTSLSI